MDSTGGIFILIALFIIVLWVVSFLMLNKHQGKKGAKRFFSFLVGTIIIEVILFITILIPSFDCKGWLCGLYELLIFLIVTGLLLFILPIVMMIMAVSTKKRKETPEVIDNTSGF